MSSFRQRKIKTLEERLENLIVDYEAASQQLSNELSGINRTRLQRQTETLEQEIEEVENELNLLRAEEGQPVSQSTSKPASLDNCILLTLYKYYREKPGNPKMNFRELLKACQADSIATIAELSKFKEFGWVDYALLDQGNAGSVWLTASGLQVAEA